MVLNLLKLFSFTSFNVFIDIISHTITITNIIDLYFFVFWINLNCLMTIYNAVFFDRLRNTEQDFGNFLQISSSSDDT